MTRPRGARPRTSREAGAALPPVVRLDLVRALAAMSQPALSLAGPPVSPPGGAGPSLLSSAPPPGGDPELDRVAALVTLAQRGDGEAFGELYDRYVSGVYRYLLARTGSVALSEDLTSETFLRALRALPSFTWQGHDVGAWFLTIARHLLLDHVRSAATRREVTTAELRDAERPDEGIEDAVVGRLESVRRAEVLLAVVRELRTDQQECLVLRFVEGLSVAETALVMGRSEGAVKQLQLRGVRALARRLAHDFPDLLPETSRTPVTPRRAAPLSRARAAGDSSEFPRGTPGPGGPGGAGGGVDGRGGGSA